MGYQVLILAGKSHTITLLVGIQTRVVLERGSQRRARSKVKKCYKGRVNKVGGWHVRISLCLHSLVHSRCNYWELTFCLAVCWVLQQTEEKVPEIKESLFSSSGETWKSRGWVKMIWQINTRVERKKERREGRREGRKKGPQWGTVIMFVPKGSRKGL